MIFRKKRKRDENSEIISLRVPSGTAILLRTIIEFEKRRDQQVDLSAMVCEWLLDWMDNWIAENGSPVC